MNKLAAVFFSLALVGAVVGGCKSSDGARKSDTNKAYEPPPRAPQPGPPDAAPPPTPEPAAAATADDASLVECVRTCVAESQMRAESPEAIRAGCVQSCSETCTRTCVERAELRGQLDDGTAEACKKSCTL